MRFKCFCRKSATINYRTKKHTRSDGTLSDPYPDELLCDSHYKEWQRDFTRPRQKRENILWIESAAVSKCWDVVRSRWPLFRTLPIEATPNVYADSYTFFRHKNGKRFAVDEYMRRSPTALSAWFRGKMKRNEKVRYK